MGHGLGYFMQWVRNESRPGLLHAVGTELVTAWVTSCNGYGMGHAWVSEDGVLAHIVTG